MTERRGHTGPNSCQSHVPLVGIDREAGSFFSFCTCFSADDENIPCPGSVHRSASRPDRQKRVRDDCIALCLLFSVDYRLCAYPRCPSTSGNECGSCSSSPARHRSFCRYSRSFKELGIARCRRMPLRRRELQLPRKVYHALFPPRAGLVQAHPNCPRGNTELVLLWIRKSASQCFCTPSLTILGQHRQTLFPVEGRRRRM